jgi:putative peptidoglycan lipid II flippase
MTEPDRIDTTAAAAVTRRTEKLNTRAAGIIGIAVMCSRVLGLARELIFAALFGGGRVMDAFTIAFRTPNLLRDLFAEGALSTAFVTTFSKTAAKEGDDAAWRLANKVATLTVVFMSGVTVLGIAIAPLLIGVLAPGFDAEKAALTVTLTRLMYPFILLVSLAALVMGMLNAKNVFGLPAMASSFFNLGSIVGGVVVGWLIDPQFGPKAVLGLAVGTLIGGALQLIVQLPALRRIGYAFEPDFAWRDRGVRAILALMGPSVIAASSTQVNVLINSIFASHLGDGPTFWLAIAFRIMQLPLGLFGVALGTVALPLLARLVANGEIDGFRTELARGLRLAFLMTIPATIGLMILAEPIMSVLYQHGKFGARETAQAAGALRFYAVGLCSYAALKVLVNSFYAIDKRNVPMLVSFGAIAVNLLLGWLLTFRLDLGHRGLALSTGCVATLNFIVLYAVMRRHLGGIDTGALMGMLGRMLAPAAVLAAVCVAGKLWLLDDWASQPFAHKVGVLTATMVVAVAAFAGSALLFRIREFEAIAAAIKRRLGRARSR